MSDERAVVEFLAVNDARCPACQYDMRGATSSVCPECGHGLRLQLAEDTMSRRVWWAAVVACATVVYADGVQFASFLWAVLGSSFYSAYGSWFAFGTSFVQALILLAILVLLVLLLRPPHRVNARTARWMLIVALLYGIPRALGATLSLMIAILT